MEIVIEKKRTVGGLKYKMSYARTKVLTSASENGVYENASPGNFEITWEEDAVLIHTTASEQEDQFTGCIMTAGCTE